MKGIIKQEETRLNDEWTLKVISFEGDSTPFRVLKDKNEVVVLDKYDYIVFHLKIGNENKVIITNKDPNVNINILKGSIELSNS